MEMFRDFDAIKLPQQLCYISGKVSQIPMDLWVLAGLSPELVRTEISINELRLCYVVGPLLVLLYQPYIVTGRKSINNYDEFN